MFKRFKRWKEKIELRWLILIEILETLVTICKYLELDQHFCSHGRFDNIFYSHADTLKAYSELLKREANWRGHDTE